MAAEKAALYRLVLENGIVRDYEEYEPMTLLVVSRRVELVASMEHLPYYYGKVVLLAIWMPIYNCGPVDGLYPITCCFVTEWLR